MTATASNFADLLDPRFKRIFDEQYPQVKDMVPMFFTVEDGKSYPTKDTARFSDVGTFGDFTTFTGTVDYDDVNQGYDKTLTHVAYTKGFQIERQLFDDDNFGIMDQKPRGIATAAARTRQKHAASLFLNSFSIDATWESNSEGVALCSDSHTTTSGASTSVGFDNRITAALSAVSVTAAHIQMQKFRGDRAEFIQMEPDTIIYPPDLYETAKEIMGSAGKVDTANNNLNVHQGVYTGIPWIYLSDVNDWWMADGTLMKQSLKWIDRVPIEFGMVEDFDTFTGRWRAYMRYSLGWTNWRWVIGSQVS